MFIQSLNKFSQETKVKSDSLIQMHISRTWSLHKKDRMQKQLTSLCVFLLYEITRFVDFLISGFTLYKMETLLVCSRTLRLVSLTC